MKLHSKIFLKGKIKLITGLHIGGVSTDLELASIVSIIKDKMDYPYIPGSSLKGKVRSLLEKAYECSNKTNLGLHTSGDIVEIFGMSANDKGTIVNAPTRVLIRDSFLLNQEELDEEDIMELKTENTIDRNTGTAKHPRTLERVVSGSEFELNIIFNVFDKSTDYELLKKLLTGMELLVDDYLGGSGSRGYGQIDILFESITEKTIENYEQGTDPNFMITETKSIKEIKLLFEKEIKSDSLGE